MSSVLVVQLWTKVVNINHKYGHGSYIFNWIEKSFDSTMYLKHLKICPEYDIKLYNFIPVVDVHRETVERRNVTVEAIGVCERQKVLFQHLASGSSYKSHTGQGARQTLPKQD